ncbi:MAG: hypothetical protein BGP24_03655 [Lysobacterales bacterium 69-70]|nr:hypothetical protein [Xanthomonadaceae bacterium]ODU32110.1 MAG: hypothetical protein ABS97_17920 [Xanthomonadaceae bacterium SCN 69-320]OJZ01832.1 MAG: hypothetical protein BGP24_03655 [Xanthomonadales bacterium 69-70]
MPLPLLSLLFVPLLAAADPCAGIDRNLADADKAALAPLIGRQLELRGVTVRESLRRGDWRVFLIGARDADDSFVFYSADPARQRYVDAIGVFALPEGEAAIRRWLTESFAAMPADLAGCVAHDAARAAKS